MTVNAVTEAAQNFSEMHLALLWGCTGIAVAVFALMLWSVATFRRTPAAAAQTRGTTAEVLWAVVPIAIVIAMAAPAVKTMMGIGTAQHGLNEMAQRARTESGPELPGDVPQKSFHEGAVPL